MRIQIINGPNINLLGKREPSIYGAVSFEDYYKKLTSQYPDIDFDYFQSNVEGEMINKIHEVGFSYDGIILNASHINSSPGCFEGCYYSCHRSPYFKRTYQRGIQT